MRDPFEEPVSQTRAGELWSGLPGGRYLTFRQWTRGPGIGFDGSWRWLQVAEGKERRGDRGRPWVAELWNDSGFGTVVPWLGFDVLIV